MQHFKEQQHQSYHTGMSTELQTQQLSKHLFQMKLLQMEFPQHLIDEYYAGHSHEIDQATSSDNLNIFIEQFVNWITIPSETCKICLQQMQGNKITLGCQHSFCRNCLTNYLNNLINNRKVEQIPCLVEGCTYMAIRDEIRTIVSIDQLNKYDHFVKNTTLSKNPNLRWCTSPTCSKYIIRDANQKKLTCECGHQVCFDCGQSWHNNSCEAEFRLQYGKIVDSLHLQKCPKCGLHVQKLSGCNHMRCTKCNYQFCWLCLGHYTDVHYRWWNLLGCPKQQNARRYWCGWKYIFALLFIPLVALALSVFLMSSVLIGVIGGMVGPFMLIRRIIYGILNVRRKVNRILLWILFLLLAVLLYPISCLLFFVPGSCILTYNFVKRFA